MNKSQLYTLSGALLASTALIGSANAGTVGRVNINITSGTNGSLSTTVPKIANTIFSATAATANTIKFVGSGTANPIAISFTNQFGVNTLFNATINIVGGRLNQAETNLGVAVLARNAASFVGTINGGCSSVTGLVDKILLSSCQLSTSAQITLALGAGVVANAVFAGGLQLSGIVFDNASALATAGGSITLDGTLNDNGNPTTVLENITSGAVITSAAPLLTTVTAGVQATANANTTPAAFKTLSAPTAGSISVNLATVNITGAGVFGTNLTTLLNPSSATAVASSVTVTVTSASLTDDATVGATMGNAGTTVTLTPAAFASGTAAFSLTAAQGFDLLNSTQTINVQFDGTHAINAAAAGTVSVAYGASVAGYPQAASGGVGGATAVIVSNGLSAEFNTAQASGTDFQSFLRIHNNGRQPGTVTITVLNDATGANMGSYTTGSIAVGQTLQVGMPTIEAGAGITSPSGQYTLQVSGVILGYAQHVLYNATTGQFSNLSAFRNAGSASNVP